MVAGKDKVYWFIFTRLDRKYNGHEIPRFDPDDIDKHLAPYMDSPVTNAVPFSEVYNRREVCNWLALEEALYKNWCIDRFAIIGDAAHKVCRTKFLKQMESTRLFNMQIRWLQTQAMAGTQPWKHQSLYQTV